jgi:hypothetical protein
LLPQSSSASRFTAGAAGFLTLSQCSTRPERPRAEPRPERAADEFGKARCRFQGGLATGSKTEAGRARIYRGTATALAGLSREAPGNRRQANFDLIGVAFRPSRTADGHLWSGTSIGPFIASTRGQCGNWQAGEADGPNSGTTTRLSERSSVCGYTCATDTILPAAVEARRGSSYRSGRRAAP